MTNKQTRDISLLSRATLFTITIHARFGNRKVIPKGKYYSEAADNRTNATMKLIESPELDRIEKYQNEIKQWCLARCMPSFITKGVYVLALTEAEEVDSALREANSILKNELVPAFLAAYPKQVMEARRPKEEGGLGSLWNEKDYPSVDRLRDAFSIEHAFISFGVPENLPEQLKAEAGRKLQKRFEAAQEEIVAALQPGLPTW